jgi:hypothetical protein
VADLRAYHSAFLAFKGRQVVEKEVTQVASGTEDSGGSGESGSGGGGCSLGGLYASGLVAVSGSAKPDAGAALLESLEFLVEAEARKGEKLVDLLLVSCYAARLLHGARTTSCKSAKDRTSVFQTLEVVRLAERWGWVDRASEPQVLDASRGPEGVRLRNCQANIGRLKYSFSPVQLRALPEELRPPAASALGGAS